MLTVIILLALYTFIKKYKNIKLKYTKRSSRGLTSISLWFVQTVVELKPKRVQMVRKKGTFFFKNKILIRKNAKILSNNKINRKGQETRKTDEPPPSKSLVFCFAEVTSLQPQLL